MATKPTHQDCNDVCRALCEDVETRLRAHLPDVRRESNNKRGEPAGCCGFKRSAAGPITCWAFHLKVFGKLDLWPLCLESDQEPMRAWLERSGFKFTFRPHSKSFGDYPFRVEVWDERDVSAILPLLVAIAEDQVAKFLGDGPEKPNLDQPPPQLMEGKLSLAETTTYERSAEARTACPRAHGLDCVVCGFNFGKRSGAIGSGFIKVHHLVPLAAYQSERQIDPLVDLVPICSNCHQMAHRKQPPYSIAQLRQFLSVNLARGEAPSAWRAAHERGDG